MAELEQHHDNPTAEQILLQMRARATAILAEGMVLSSFKHRGLSGIEREEPVRHFIRSHLPGRFHVGQGSIASVDTILGRQHDIVVADHGLSFMLLNTVSAQLQAIESVHLIIEVRSRFGEIDEVAKSLRCVRGLRATEGVIQLGNRGSDTGTTAPPVQTIVVYQGPKTETTAIEHLRRVNAEETEEGKRLPIDFILVLAKEGDQRPESGYLIGYARTDTKSGFTFSHHYYPQVNEVGLDGPKVICSGGDSFANWFAGILNHLSGVTAYPPNLYNYLGRNITLIPWDKKPF